MRRVSLSALESSVVLVATLVLTISPTSLAGRTPDATNDLGPSPSTAELAPSRVLQVGPTRAFQRVSEAAKAARDGDAIEIDAGEYVGDVAVWTQRRISVRGVGGRPRLTAAGSSAEGKAIWVVRVDDMRIENIEFRGARVLDRNGAGIRLERGRLTVKGCVFRDNENGILTGSDASAELAIENSEFDRNGAGDGYSHNLYVGSLAKLTVTGSWFHRARVGHLLKSRARENYILYNRLTDEIDGTASYELEFPNGGVAFVLGNLIQQSSASENPIIVAFGREGYGATSNELYLSHNTIVNDRPDGGVFVFVERGATAIGMSNNIFVGPGKMSAGTSRVTKDNVALQERTDFAHVSRLDMRLRVTSPLAGKAIASPLVRGVSLRPSAEYVHPVGTKPLSQDAPLSPGAFQSTAP
jgi:hypothetical protein